VTNHTQGRGRRLSVTSAAVRAAGLPWRLDLRTKEQNMPSATSPSSDAEKRREEIHRAQLSLVQASLRAGVQYQRPGRVAKAAAKRS
jgi:hypothetical protein